jgi:serine/threonine protein kinase
MIDNNFNLKLADFGLAKMITQSYQMANSFVGTLIYSCP